MLPRRTGAFARLACDPNRINSGVIINGFIFRCLERRRAVGTGTGGNRNSSLQTADEAPSMLDETNYRTFGAYGTAAVRDCRRRYRYRRNAVTSFQVENSVLQIECNYSVIS